MGQEVGDLIQDVDPEVVVVDADVDVHAADQQPVRHDLHVPLQDFVPFLFGVLLVLPFRERVCRGSDRSQAMVPGDFRDSAPQVAQVGPHLGYRIANRRTDFDLGAQELPAELAAEPSFVRVDE